MLQSGILPPDKVVQLSLEMLKMLLHPVRHSRPVIELIDDFQEQLQLQAAVAAMMPPAPMVPPPGQPGVPAPPGGPMRGVSHSPPHVGGARGVPPGANGGAPPPGPPQAPAPPVAQPVQ